MLVKYAKFSSSTLDSGFWPTWTHTLDVASAIHMQHYRMYISICSFGLVSSLFLHQWNLASLIWSILMSNIHLNNICVAMDMKLLKCCFIELHWTSRVLATNHCIECSCLHSCKPFLSHWDNTTDQTQLYPHLWVLFLCSHFQWSNAHFESCLQQLIRIKRYILVVTVCVNRKMLYVNYCKC